MAKEYAYIHTPVKSIEFSLPYSDGSGNRLKVSISGKMKDVYIESIDSILVSVEDIEWLRQALGDIKEIVMLSSEQNVQVGDTTDDAQGTKAGKQNK